MAIVVTIVMGYLLLLSPSGQGCGGCGGFGCRDHFQAAVVRERGQGGKQEWRQSQRRQNLSLMSSIERTTDHGGDDNATTLLAGPRHTATSPALLACAQVHHPLLLYPPPPRGDDKSAGEFFIQCKAYSICSMASVWASSSPPSLTTNYLSWRDQALTTTIIEEITTLTTATVERQHDCNVSDEEDNMTTMQQQSPQQGINANDDQANNGYTTMAMTTMTDYHDPTTQ
ncbi:hypothetical protein V8E53_013084 [Lactarius tabidus]